MSGPQCCANPPTLNPNSGAGHVEKLGGLDTYVTGSPDSKLAAVLISDIFGTWPISVSCPFTSYIFTANYDPGWVYLGKLHLGCFCFSLLLQFSVCMFHCFFRFLFSLVNFVSLQFIIRVACFYLSFDCLIGAFVGSLCPPFSFVLIPPILFTFIFLHL